MKKEVKKSVRFAEEKGGSLPIVPDAPAAPQARPQVTAKRQTARGKVYDERFDHQYYTDTPMKRVFRELSEGWAPLSKYQEVPDFKLMESALQHDTTSFPDDRPRLVSMPEKPPTGHGYMMDDRETSHFVHHTLRGIDPVLARAYLGGHVSDYHDRLQTNTEAQYGGGYRPERDTKARQRSVYTPVYPVPR